MKEKAKSAPKELVRRGLDDGTERLRGQLRDTAQRGQADDYGGDQIEDTAVGGARRAERGIENLLKKKKAGRQEVSRGHAPSQEPPAPEPRPEGAPPPAQAGGDSSPTAPRAADRPRIKTRDAMTAREGGIVPSEGGRLEPTPAAGSERQRIKIRESTVRGGHEDAAPSPRDGTELPRIRTREVAVYEVPASVEPTEQTGSVRPQIKTRDVSVRDIRANVDADPQAAPELMPQIKTREAAAGAPPDYQSSTATPSGKGPPEQLSIKTKDAYIQRQAATAPEQPSQAFTQGQQGFAQEHGRRATMKRAEAQRTGNSTVPQGKDGGDAAPSAPARRGYTSEGYGYVPDRRKYSPAQPVHKPASPGNPDIQPVQEGGKKLVKTARSARKVPERAARRTIKTAERASKTAVKTTQRTVKTAQQTAKAAQKTAQATVKATQRAVQAARAAAKAAVTTAKAAVKATIAAVKAAIAAIQSLAAAIAAGGWVAVVVILVICLVALVLFSVFGIFFSDESNDPNAVSPSAAVAQINQEYADTLSGYQTGGSYDSVEIIGRPPSWVDVFAVFAVKTVTGDGMDVVVLDADRVERLQAVFWDMTKITTETKTVDHPATEDADAWTETVLVITVTPRTTDDMRVFYAFTEEQNAALDELLTAESRELWSNLLYGDCGEFVAVALSQVGNVGGQPYWSWYGFNSRVEWCACFVSWCANECGYIDTEIIPKFAGCTGGSNWFKERGQWQDGSYEPRPGDLVFFDWDNKGSSGPQDDVPDHVGIVERVENGIVYTVEGNSSDSCRQRSYSVGYYEIWGYGCPTF